LSNNFDKCLFREIKASSKIYHTAYLFLQHYVS